MRCLTVIIAAALLCVAVDGQTFGMDDEDVVDCVDYVVCEIRDMDQFKKTMEPIKPKAKEYMVKLMREHYGWEDFNDDEASWMDYPNKYCPNSREQKKKLGANVGVDMSDFWGKMCDEEDEDECNGMEEACAAMSMLLTENLAQGKCGKAARAMKAAKIPGFGR